MSIEDGTEQMRKRVRLQQTLAGTSLTLLGLDKMDEVLAKLHDSVTETLRLEAIDLLRGVIKDRREAIQVGSQIVFGDETEQDQQRVDHMIQYALYGRSESRN